MSGELQQLLRDCTVELENIQKWISNNSTDSNVKFLTSYSVIKACSTIEQVMKKMFYDYLSVGANSEAKMFLYKNIVDTSINPSVEKIYKILEKVNSDWKINFENKVKASDQKGQLTSLVKVRNSFAHGSDISVSINNVINYFNSGKWILEQLDDTIQGK